MSLEVPREILDALTDVEMPRLPPEPAWAGHVEAAGCRMPVFSAGAQLVARPTSSWSV